MRGKKPTVSEFVFVFHFDSRSIDRAGTIIL